MQSNFFQRGLAFLFPFGLVEMGNILATDLEKEKKMPSFND